MMSDHCSILINNGRLAYDKITHLPEGIILDDCNKDYNVNIVISSNTRISTPIHLTIMFDDDCDDNIEMLNMLNLETGSSAKLIIKYCITDNARVNIRERTVIKLEKSSVLDMVREQKMNAATKLFSETCIHQLKFSRMKTHYVTLGGGNITNLMEVSLSDEKTQHDAFGLSLTRKNEHVENEIKIIHGYPDCQSNQLFKHILFDVSTGSFTGRIVVNSHAQKTKAYQRSSNILMNPKAKMYIRPQLEIYADDVKCSHGATVGQLDAEALFYLRSRGIDEIEAKKLLLRAFACEAIEKISCMAFRENIMRLAELD